MILDGRAVAQKVLAEVRKGVARLRATGVVPTLAVVLVGDDPASKIYVGNKKKAAEGVGIASQDHLHPGGLEQAALLDLLRRLNADPAVHGILLQLPLPKGLDEDEAVEAIAPAKDADGLHPTNLGRLLARAVLQVVEHQRRPVTLRQSGQFLVQGHGRAAGPGRHQARRVQPVQLGQGSYRDGHGP